MIMKRSVLMILFYTLCIISSSQNDSSVTRNAREKRSVWISSSLNLETFKVEINDPNNSLKAGNGNPFLLGLDFFEIKLNNLHFASGLDVANNKIKTSLYGIKLGLGYIFDINKNVYILASYAMHIGLSESEDILDSYYFRYPLFNDFSARLNYQFGNNRQYTTFLKLGYNIFSQPKWFEIGDETRVYSNGMVYRNDKRINSSQLNFSVDYKSTLYIGVGIGIRFLKSGSL